MDRTKNQSRPRSLFLSPRFPTRSLSKNALSFFLRETILESGAVWGQEGRPPRAHDIRGVGVSLHFYRNWSVSKVCEAATWRSNTVFVSFYLKDLGFSYDNLRSLGPIVAAGEVLRTDP